MRDLFSAADIIAVSGGNTLFGVNRWKRLGVDTMLREASERGAVMVGGSAGAICWFDGGHSDSFDPTTVRACMCILILCSIMRMRARLLRMRRKREHQLPSIRCALLSDSTVAWLHASPNRFYNLQGICPKVRRLAGSM
jgi:hypothetical protein